MGVGLEVMECDVEHTERQKRLFDETLVGYKERAFCDLRDPGPH